MTMTYGEIVAAEVALQSLANRGYKSQKIAKKVARCFIWAKGKREEYDEARRILVEAHGMKDADGKQVYERVQNKETGEWRDDFNNIRLKDPEAFMEELKKLQATAIQTNGLQFTEKELEQCNTPPEPSIYIDLGPMLKWDEEIDETKPEIVPDD
jgi:hypothetical protein